jgi:hypothetical protein
VCGNLETISAHRKLSAKEYLGIGKLKYAFAIFCPVLAGVETYKFA